jgi:hypothetical protein
MQRGIDRSLSLTLFYERINKMTYIELINAFEIWLETNYLPVPSQLLWYKLIRLFNRCGWAEWISVENQTLMSVMKIKREATFIEVRNKLLDAKFFEYKKGKKGSPNQYKINTDVFESINSSKKRSKNSSKKRS